MYPDILNFILRHYPDHKILGCVACGQLDGYWELNPKHFVFQKFIVILDRF